MKAVFTYLIDIEELPYSRPFYISESAKVLGVDLGRDGKSVKVIIEEYPDETKDMVCTVHCFGTGQPIKPGLHYMGSVDLYDGLTTTHVYFDGWIIPCQRMQEVINTFCKRSDCASKFWLDQPHVKALFDLRTDKPEEDK